MENKLKSAIDRHYAEVEMTPELTEKMLAAATDGPRPGRRARRGVSVLVAAAILLLVCLPVFGATLPSVNAVISRISPELAALLMPVDETAAVNDVEITLVSAVADDYSMLLVMEARDLSGEDRLSENLLPLFRLESGDGQEAGRTSGGRYDMVYDRDTGALGIRFVLMIDEPLPGRGQADFYIESLLSGNGRETVVEGEWAFSFQPRWLEHEQIGGDFMIRDREFGNLSLSPLTLTFAGPRQVAMSYLEIELVLEDGTVYRYGHRNFVGEWIDGSIIGVGSGEDGYLYTVVFGAAIERDQIVSLTISGNRII